MDTGFDKVFVKAVKQLKADAIDAGMSFSQVCTEAGVARATPDRWLHQPPKTVRLLSRMQEVVAAERGRQEVESEEPGEQ